MKTKNKKRYSNAEKKAYWMGVGAGVVNKNSSNDSSVEYTTRICKGFGNEQHPHLVSAFKKGYSYGKEKVEVQPFIKGYNYYPLERMVWLGHKPDRKKKTRRNKK